MVKQEVDIPIGVGVVAEEFRWQEAPTAEFHSFIKKTMRPFVTGAQGVDTDPKSERGMPLAYQDYAARLLADMNYPVREWKFYIGVTQPLAENATYPSFAEGFPHRHNLDALTVTHCVQAPEYGGDLLIVDWQHSILRRIPSEVGVTAVVDGHSLHGVELVRGKVPRYTLIATGYHA